jgi:hypothetical protein
MNALQIIAVLLAGAFIIGFYVNSPKTPPPDQMPELTKHNVTILHTMPVLSNLNATLTPALNASNVTNATNALAPLPPFNISISFTSTHNATIAVEIPAHAISGMPEIHCNERTFTPMPDLTVLSNTTNLYFYNCSCGYMNKARLDFDNHSTTFFVLDAGNGWDFTLNKNNTMGGD